MGTLLTTILVGGSQHLRQRKVAQHKRLAVQKLDQFVATWSAANFSEEGLQEASFRSGLWVRGLDLSDVSLLKDVGHQTRSQPSQASYQLEMRTVRDAPFLGGVIHRLAVIAPNTNGLEVAWVEVMAQQ